MHSLIGSYILSRVTTESTIDQILSLLTDGGIDSKTAGMIGSLILPVYKISGGHVCTISTVVCSPKYPMMELAPDIDLSKNVPVSVLTFILAELSITRTSLESNSAAIQPGMNPSVTGRAIINTNAAMTPMRSSISINCRILVLRMVLLSSVLINLTVLKSTFLIRKRLKKWIMTGMLIAVKNQRMNGDKTVTALS